MGNVKKPGRSRKTRAPDKETRGQEQPSVVETTPLLQPEPSDVAQTDTGADPSSTSTNPAADFPSTENAPPQRLVEPNSHMDLLPVPSSAGSSDHEMDTSTEEQSRASVEKPDPGVETGKGSQYGRFKILDGLLSSDRREPMLPGEIIRLAMQAAEDCEQEYVPENTTPTKRTPADAEVTTQKLDASVESDAKQDMIWEDALHALFPEHSTAGTSRAAQETIPGQDLAPLVDQKELPAKTDTQEARESTSELAEEPTSVTTLNPANFRDPQLRHRDGTTTPDNTELCSQERPKEVSTEAAETLEPPRKKRTKPSFGCSVMGFHPSPDSFPALPTSGNRGPVVAPKRRPATTTEHPFRAQYDMSRFVLTTKLTTNPTTTKKTRWFPGVDEAAQHCITIYDVERFRTASLSWINDVIEAPEHSATVPTVRTSEKPSGIVALYYVANITGTEAKLRAVHFDLYAPGRGDLRQISLSRLSNNTLQPGAFDVRANLAVGDLVFVQKLAPTDKGRTLGRDAMLKIGPRECGTQSFSTVWRAQHFQVLQRCTVYNRLALCIGINRRNGRQVTGYRLAVEGLPQVIVVSSAMTRTMNVQLDAMYEIELMIPPEQLAMFSMGPKNKEARAELRRMVNKLKLVDKLRASVVNIRQAAPETINYCQNRPQLFQLLPPADATLMLARSFAMVVPALNALEREGTDSTEYQSTLQYIQQEGDSHLYQYEAYSFQGKPALNGFKRNNRVSISSTAKTKTFVVGKIKTVIAQAASILVTIAVKGRYADRLAERVNQEPDTIFSITQQSEETMEANPAERLFLKPAEEIAKTLSSGQAATSVKALFGGSPLSSAWTTQPLRVRFRGQDIDLAEEQAGAVRVILSRAPITTVIASYGCGKTLVGVTANAMQAHQDTEGGLHVVAAQANNATLNALRAAESLEEYDEPLVRLISEPNWRLQQETSHLDLPPLLEQVLRENKNRLSEHDQKIVEYVVSDRDILVDWEEPNEDEVKNDLEALQVDASKSLPKPGSRAAESRILELFWQCYGPRRVFATISTLLSMFGEKGRLQEKASQVRSILLDEASQLAESTLLALVACFPNAAIALVGDPRQLPPFATSSDSNMLAPLANGSLLPRIRQNRLCPTVELTSVRRSHPLLTSVISEVFYDGTLRALATAEERSSSEVFLTTVTEGVPWCMVHSPGEEMARENSWVNVQQAEDVAAIVARLLQNGAQPDQLAVLSLYRPQADLLSTLLPAGVFCSTVDASQGREWSVVLLTTVRSQLPSNAVFFCDKLRANVAVTRAREAVLLVGDERILSVAPVWRQILRHIAVWNAAAPVNRFLDGQD